MKRSLSMATVLTVGTATLIAQESETVQPVETTAQVVPEYAPTMHMPAHMNWGETVIPVIAITSPFIMVVLVVFIVLRYKSKERHARYALMQKAMEAGVELPKDLFAEPEKVSRPQIVNSLIPIFVGIALFIALATMMGFEIAVWGLIPFAVGLANLIGYLYSKKQQSSVSPNRDNEQNA